MWSLRLVLRNWALGQKPTAKGLAIQWPCAFTMPKHHSLEPQDSTGRSNHAGTDLAAPGRSLPGLVLLLRFDNVVFDSRPPSARHTRMHHPSKRSSSAMQVGQPSARLFPFLFFQRVLSRIICFFVGSTPPATSIL